MRFMFKTDYEDDIKLFPHSGYIVTYGILLAFLAVAPFVLSSYLVSQLVFVFIYATVGVGLMILTGFTGQASLGHAAFLAIGAYTAAYLQQYNVPFPVYFLVAGVLIGVIESMAGFYLPQGWKDVAPYIVLLMVLLLKPEGLFGHHARKKV